MTELEKLVLWSTAIAAVVCLVGPACSWSAKMGIEMGFS